MMPVERNKEASGESCEITMTTDIDTSPNTTRGARELYSAVLKKNTFL